MPKPTSAARTRRRTTAAGRAHTGPSVVHDDRRTRLRLRELCDEVLASYRVASERDLFSERDREDARAMIGGFSRRG